MSRAMTAALNKPATGTVTNQARKMFRKRRQSTAFRERSQPTATTEPTCIYKHTKSAAALNKLRMLSYIAGGQG